MCPNSYDDFDYDMNEEFMPLDEDEYFDDDLLEDNNSTSSALDVVMLRECSFVTRISPPLTKIRECRIRSLTGGCVTITNINDEVVSVKSPRIEIRPSIGEDNDISKNNVSFQYDLDQSDNMDQDFDTYSYDLSNCLPSGCQELPGWRFGTLDTTSSHCQQPATSRSCQTQSVGTQKDLEDGAPDSPQEIRVSATLQLPANVNQCSVNITATRTTSPQMAPASLLTRPRSPPPPYSVENTTSRLAFRGCSNNFNGGGIVNVLSSRPPTPPLIEDLMPETRIEGLRFGNLYPLINTPRDYGDMKKRLEMCDFYYEDISWQESTEILKNAPHGRWILRNSRNHRAEFAISVQTSTGPTSIRINCNMGQFRLDADSNLTFEVPFFTCIFELIRYYIEYSKVVEKKRKVVWVDYSRRLYNQIYLSERPLYKRVSSLTHLARLCINKNKLGTAKLPPSLQKYCREYPYSF